MTKLTVLFLLAATLESVAGARAQKITLDLKAAPLLKVFKEISRQTGLSVIYDEVQLAAARSVTISVHEAPIDEVLVTCLHDQGLSYSLSDGVLLIRRKDLVATRTSEIPLPPIDVHGHVVDSMGAPLSGASVTVKGRNISIMTDANGDFYLRDIGSTATIIISNIGFETQEIKFKGSSTITVRLKVHSTSLLDVVVNKGYYNTTQRLNTGNVSTVSGEDIQKQPVSDPLLALIGRVPGLNIQQTSGVPGQNMIVQIRGVNSLFSGLDPLYIIDGVPYGSTSLTNYYIGGGVLGSPGRGSGMSPFNNLNPADIERIEVLKDAEATAIYGSRGANGVILITTRKGQAGDSKVDVNVYTGASKVPYEVPLLNTKQYLAMRHEAILNDGHIVGVTDYDVNGAWDTTRYTDWQKVLIGKAATFSNAQCHIYGGDANTQFLIGGGYSIQGTSYAGDYSDKKASLSSSITHKSLNRRFGLQFSTEYVHDNSHLPQVDFAHNITLAPDAPALFTPAGDLNFQLQGGGPTWNNPLVETRRYADAISNTFISSLGLSYQIIPDLQIKGHIGYNRSQMDQTILTPGTFYPPPQNEMAGNRHSFYASNQTENFIVEPQIDYHRKIMGGTLEGLLGFTIQDNNSSSNAQYASGFSSDALITNSSAALFISSSGNTDAVYHYSAMFGRLSYDWQNKFIINFTGRRDGSSRFGTGKQFGNFGAFGAGWIFSSERFIQNSLPFLSFGKLRISYGTVGNDQIGDYQFLSTYYSSGVSYQGMVGLAPSGLANPTLSWERVNKREEAIELGFLKDRVLFTIASYDNRTHSQLISYSLPNFSGFSFVTANSPATLQNTGVEITLKTINIREKEFAWKSSINISVENNKLLSYPGLENSSYSTLYKIGKSILSMPIYHYTGVDPQLGIYTFSTKNGNGQPSYPDDLSFSKPVTQHYYGGLLNSVSFKKFQLDIFIHFVRQLKLSYVSSFNPPGLFNSNQLNLVLNHWQAPGNVSNVEKYTTSYGSAAGNAYLNYSSIPSSDGVIVDGSFIRLQNLALSYELADQWKNKVHIKSLKVYMQCQNLFVITGYKGLDPETGQVLPPLRTITGGIQVAF